MKSLLHSLAIILLTAGTAILLCGYSGLFRHFLLATNFDTPDDVLQQKARTFTLGGWPLLVIGLLFLFIARFFDRKQNSSTRASEFRYFEGKPPLIVLLLGAMFGCLQLLNWIVGWPALGHTTTNVIFTVSLVLMFLAGFCFTFDCDA